MSKTYSQDWYALIDGLLDGMNRPARHFGIAGAVGYDDAIEGEVHIRGEEVEIPRYGYQAHISGQQGTRNVAFGATIQQDDGRIAIAFFRDIAGRNARYQVIAIGIIERDVLIEDNLAEHGAVFANVPGQQARILDFQGRNFFLL